jgi:AraC-like DNA-binding protein
MHQIEALARRAAAMFTHDDDGLLAPPGLTGLRVLRHRRPTVLQATLYDPVVCLILQGRKETTLAERRVEFGPGEALLVSHDLPVSSRITEASDEAPYLALMLALDFSLLRRLGDPVHAPLPGDDDALALDVHHAAPELVDAFGRYLALGDAPREREVLGPLVTTELHFRILQAPSSGMLRRLLREDTTTAGVARAIERIRAGFRDRLVVPELAQSVGMSASTFHQHFKAITRRSPLQYQKELRLLEAHRLLTAERARVSDVAFRVGYESPSQFSREYSRKFGTAPSAARVSS